MRISNAIFVLILFIFGCGESEKNPDALPAKINFNWVKIPSGTYILGDSLSSVNPIHEVTVKEFYITPHEITNAQFADFVKETGYITTAEKYKNAKVYKVGLAEFEWAEDSTANWKVPYGTDKFPLNKYSMDYPVTCISFIDVQEYCKWAGVRLPTLDEWEIACRAGTRTKYFFGEDASLIHEYANIWRSRKHDSIEMIDQHLLHSKGGTFKPNPWGLYDVYGNNFEFCADHFALQQNKEKVACARGGSWWCSKNSCNFFNSVDIGSVNKFASFSNHGFRVVKE